MNYFDRCKKIDEVKAANPAAFEAAAALEQEAQQAKRAFDDIGCLWPSDSADVVANHESLEKTATEKRAAADAAWLSLDLA